MTTVELQRRGDNFWYDVFEYVCADWVIQHASVPREAKTLWVHASTRQNARAWKTEINAACELLVDGQYTDSYAGFRDWLESVGNPCYVTLEYDL